MIQADYRIGGDVRYILTDKPRMLMYVPDEIRKCVGFVGMRLATGEYLLKGTVFFVSRLAEDTGGRFSYAITAKHVIEGIRRRGVDKVQLRLNVKGGGARWFETDLSDWLFHPTEPEVDVAVLPKNLAQIFGHLNFPITSFATEDIIAERAIGSGDEVFFTGLFVHHKGHKRNIPIVRVGNIAAMPEERVDTRIGLIDAYLVEARSIGGLSGSPVFVHLGPTRIKGNTVGFTTGQVFYLLGLMHGHFETNLPKGDVTDLVMEDALVEERVNMGIAIVVPASKIVEVIAQPMIRDKENQEIEEYRAQHLPVLDAIQDGTNEGDADAGLTQEQFLTALGKVSQPLQPLSDEGTS